MEAEGTAIWINGPSCCQDSSFPEKKQQLAFVFPGVCGAYKWGFSDSEFLEDSDLNGCCEQDKLKNICSAI